MCLPSLFVILMKTHGVNSIDDLSMAKGKEASYRRWNRRSETQGIRDTWAGNLSPRERENLIPGESGRTGVRPGMSPAQVRGRANMRLRVGWGFTSIGLTGEPGWWLIPMCSTPHLGTVHSITVWDGRDTVWCPLVSVGEKWGFSVHSAGLYSMPAHSFVISPWP